MNPSVSQSAGGAWRALFLVAGVYDVLLGLAFLVAGESILKSIGMQLPPHIAFIHLSAIFIVVQGISYLLVYRSPSANVGLVWVGILYKASYAGLAAWYLITNQMPSSFFVPWAVADAAFLVAFLLFIRATGSRQAG
jgi:hypothetical protein